MRFLLNSLIVMLCLIVPSLSNVIIYLGLCGGCSFLGCSLSNPFSLGDGAPLCGDVGSSLASSTTKSWNKEKKFDNTVDQVNFQLYLIFEQKKAQRVLDKLFNLN